MKVMTKDAANILLEIITADGKRKVEDAGGNIWSKIGEDDDGVVLIFKVLVPKGEQTTLTDFEKPED